jgi:hypothetical protein
MTRDTVVATFTIVTLAGGLGYGLGKLVKPSGPYAAHTPGGIMFMVPGDFARSRAQPENDLEALRIVEAETYSRREGEGYGEVVVGQGNGEGPALLGPAETSLPATEDQGLVRLSQSYIGVKTTGKLDVAGEYRRATLLSVPTVDHTVYVLCLPPGSDAAATGFLRACEQVASTLELPQGDGRPLTVGMLDGAISGLEGIMRRYGRERVLLRGKLARAKTTSAAGLQAERLIFACDEVDTSMLNLPPDPMVQMGRKKLQAAMVGCQQSYRSLARAIALRDARGATHADTAIRAADRTTSKVLLLLHTISLR